MARRKVHAGTGVPSVVTGVLRAVPGPSLSVVPGSLLRVMPAAAASACVSLLIDVRGPAGRRAFCSRLRDYNSRCRRWRMRVLYDRVAAIDVRKGHGQGRDPGTGRKARYMPRGTRPRGIIAAV